MREVVLSTQKGGISRLRERGGASPETLYQLRNAYVTTAKTIRQRPGLTTIFTLNPGTVGWASYGGQYFVFASTFIPQPAGVTCIVLKHPTVIDQTLTKIHFAQTFLGRFYVSAEFANGDVRHYWVTNAPQWSPNGGYGYKQKVVPTTPTGFVYEVSNVISIPSWAPGETIVVSDVRQPRVYNGIKYTAIAVTGAAPVKTSDTEPVWPTVEGGTIVEYSYGGVPPTPTPPPTPTYPPDIGGEYGPFPPGGGPYDIPLQIA